MPGSAEKTGRVHEEGEEASSAVDLRMLPGC